MAAIVARGMSATALRARRKCCPRASASLREMTRLGSSGARNSEISAPAAKIRSPPVTTTAPGGSSWRTRAAASSWRSSSVESAFTLPCCRRRTATPPGRRSTWTRGSGMAGDATPIGPSTRTRSPVEELLGGRPRVDGPVGHLGGHLAEAPVGLALDPLAHERGHDLDDLVGQPLPSPHGQLPGGLEVSPVLADRGPQLVHPALLGGDGLHDRGPPAAVDREVEHPGEVSTGLARAGPVGLVDDEHVGD